jgi:hypothetical protein
MAAASAASASLFFLQLIVISDILDFPRDFSVTEWSAINSQAEL